MGNPRILTSPPEDNDNGWLDQTVWTFKIEIPTPAVGEYKELWQNGTNEVGDLTECQNPLGLLVGEPWCINIRVAETILSIYGKCCWVLNSFFFRLFP